MEKRQNLLVQMALQNAIALLYEAEQSVLELVEESLRQNIKADALFKESTGHDIYEAMSTTRENIKKLPDDLRKDKVSFNERLNAIEKIIKEFSI